MPALLFGESQYVEGSGDELAIPLAVNISPKFQTLQDRILITAAGSKSVSSSQGHQLMEKHPYRDIRYAQAKNNIGLLIESMTSGNWKRFSSVVEEEAMSLHALMINSESPYTLMNQNTWDIIHEIRKIREEKSVEITYTLDAGPNVHLIFPKSIEKEMDSLIREHLLQYCLDNRVINDHLQIC
jgi:diphosphomevalonate decarboxylase